MADDQVDELAGFVTQMMDSTAQTTTSFCAVKFKEEERRKKEELKRKSSIPLEQLTLIAREKALRKRQK